MPSFDPQDLAGWTGGSWFNEPKVAIEGLCFDARQIKPGQCFIALKISTRDGHEFLEQAARGGAVAAIVENTKPIVLPQLKVSDSLVALGAIGAALRSKFSKPVVGITGSCGKTSTKEMLRCLLGEDRTHATAGNWNNRIGVPMTLSGLDSNQQDFAVIEAGINQPNEMVQLGGMIQADLNVLTNIEAAHLELLSSLENIASEKSLLAELAKPGSPIILHVDSLRFNAYKKLAHRAIVLLPEGVAAPDLPSKQIVRYKVSEQWRTLEQIEHCKHRNKSLLMVKTTQLRVRAKASRATRRWPLLQLNIWVLLSQISANASKRGGLLVIADTLKHLESRLFISIAIMPILRQWPMHWTPLTEARHKILHAFTCSVPWMNSAQPLPPTTKPSGTY